MAFYVPKSTIYTHSNTRKLLEVKNLYHKGNEIIKFRNLEIWKLLGVKNTYYKGNEIIKFGNEAIKYKNRNIDKTKIHKNWKIKKLAQGNRNRCEAKKLKKLIVLNYTERGKQQKIYNCFYTISILYTIISYNFFLYILFNFVTYRLYLRKIFFSTILKTKLSLYFTYIYIRNLVPWNF